MKICLSLNAQNQLNSHFGAPGQYVLLDSESGAFTPHATMSALCQGPCRCVMPESADAQFEAVICRAIGHRVLLDYRRRGIAVFLCQESDPIQAWQAWHADALALAARSFCRAGRRKSMASAPVQPIFV